MERWSITVQKEYFNFAAAHFLIFPDGSKERLHGHNYRVYVEIEAALSRHGLVIDFKQVKPVVRELLDELDEHWIIPGEHPEMLTTRRDDGITEVRYREAFYAAPTEDIIVLPVNNTSSENLSGWLGRELRHRVVARFEGVDVRRLRLAVEETPGQCGVYYFDSEDESGEARLPTDGA